ncbi:MAG: carbon-nitrogen hydrolase family protein [Chloroflexi bacterium]|nr:carbon-nitrogen hydrolase family protein [Chloroflexota bacterium]
MGDVYPTLRVAAVQAASVFLDREASIEKACRLIREAGAQGARVIGFPESFIPGHPLWYHFHPATSSTSVRLAVQLACNSVEVPSSGVAALCAAARAADAYVVIGLCERKRGSLGTMYNSQLFIDRHGRVLGTHRKLVPTFGERMVHTGGQGDSMRTFDTEFGPIGGLICGENANPLAIFTLASMGARIIVASWPPHFSRVTHRMCDIVDAMGRFLSYSAGCVVIAAVGAIDDELRRVLPSTEEDRAFLEANTGAGGSMIVSGKTRVLAGPQPPGEAILYADVDLNDLVFAKLGHDFAGHYNRPDIFTLSLNAATPALFERHGAPLESPKPKVQTPASHVEAPGEPAPEGDGTLQVSKPELQVEA